MGYQALYRAWRPQQFKDVVGQELITQTLRNAVSSKQISHAYLFTGPRGTGKTSTAKIFAKAINCHHLQNGEPCNECEICKAISVGNLNDVLEIDAASNNGVEEIRDIRDKVKYAPTQADYKIYIIDEVHMLSMGAFNALLKTLEEPPKNVVFILATTEPHKIPATIISRTQRFDFHRITPEIILQRMEYILKQKQISYENTALEVIARTAEGGMRDALSILDQVISFGENDVTLDNALLVTGSVDKTDLLKYLRAVFSNDVPTALKIIHRLIIAGKDAARIVEDLTEYCRDLLLYKQSPSMLTSNEQAVLDDNFKELIQIINAQIIYQAIDALNEQQENMRFATHPTVCLEVLTVKLANLKINLSQSSNAAQNAQITRLSQQVKQLQSQLNSLQNATVPTPVIANKHPKISKAKVTEVKINFTKVKEVLDNATRKDLNRFQQIWDDLQNMLTVPQKAIMNVSRPVAASAHGVVIGFKYPYLCQKAMDDSALQDALVNGLSRLSDSQVDLLFLPNDQWQQIRSDYIKKLKVSSTAKQEDVSPKVDEDPIITKAQSLFGKEIVKIKAD